MAGAARLFARWPPGLQTVCIGLVVNRSGMPLRYEVFAGNRHDSTTVEEIVETMERRYGRSNRIAG